VELISISSRPRKFETAKSRGPEVAVLSTDCLGAGRSSRLDYLRAAQAYMLISMPTDTSTIFGVFQAIGVSSFIVRELHAGQNLKPPQRPRKRNLS
jgi:hypothetical protein